MKIRVFGNKKNRKKENLIKIEYLIGLLILLKINYY